MNFRKFISSPLSFYQAKFFFLITVDFIFVFLQTKLIVSVFGDG